MKPVVSIFLSFLLMFGSIVPTSLSGASPTQPDIEFYADCLKIMGLFSGTNNGYETDRCPTRIETAVMLTRLLGKEEDALSSNLSHPFTDVPPWADPYIGYLFQNGLIKGVGNNLFGSDFLVTPLQYAVFVLRSLGYTEEKGDFTYDQALDKMLSLGVLNKSELHEIAPEGEFTRGLMAYASFKTLQTLIKGSEERLIDRLVRTGAVSELCVNALGMIKFPGDIPEKDGVYAINNRDQLDKLVRWALFTGTDRLVLDPAGYAQDIHRDAIDSLKENDKYVGVFKSAQFKWFLNTKGNVTRYEMDIQYAVNATERKELNRQACHIIANLVSPGMTEVQKETVIHDYIVNRAVYGFSDHCYDAYGALIQKEAVCQGYSRAMILLSSLAGVYCMEVVGTDQGTAHSWNIVRLDGEYYHVDVSFDDPIGEVDVLRHYYFNVTDRDLEGHREWERNAYPRCEGVKYNYYRLNNTYVADRDQMIASMVKSYSKGVREFEYRLENYNREDFTREGMKAHIRELTGKIKGSISSYSWVSYDRISVIQITLR